MSVGNTEQGRSGVGVTGMEGEADHRRSMRAEVIAELREQVGARVARTARTVRPPLRLNASLRSLLVADLYGTGTGTGTGTGAGTVI